MRRKCREEQQEHPLHGSGNIRIGKHNVLLGIGEGLDAPLQEKKGAGQRGGVKGTNM